MVHSPTISPVVPGARFDDAVVLASELHRSQRRKGSGVPYLAHLLQVAGLVLEAGGDEETAIAALLHDAIEDQGGGATRARIVRQFGERVARFVDGCSDSSGSPKPPWRQRKLDHIGRMATESPEVRLIVAADKIHNARSITSDYRRRGDTLWPIFHGGRDGTLWYLHAMTDALIAADPDGPLLDELGAALATLDALVATGD
ncbi:MAG TPA: HD domain-containing protein [Thermomicrobiales bacterium]|jgi:GTP pyrophosphokinase|nr:HD domain-containing protein [Thermomicrobiales bacterium]